jgi:ADP-ribosyl-[dinitrogen reductase] hydrolase
MKHPNPDLLVRIAQGDACGMATEFISLPEHRATKEAALRLDAYGQHPTHHEVRAGHYTDDTQMSIAVAEVLLGHDPPSTERFADAFVACFKRDPRKGYSRGFQVLLESVGSGAELSKRIRADSDKNGAAMRSVPIGVLPDPERVVEIASLQARITHDTEGGIRSAVAVALMSHYALWTDAPLSEVRSWLETRMPDAPIPKTPWSAAVAGDELGWKTAMAALTLVESRSSLLDIARTAIDWGGDTDSVLAIAFGIASTRLREPLPRFFDDDLERGPYGRTFLADLGAALMKRFA